MNRIISIDWYFVAIIGLCICGVIGSQYNNGVFDNGVNVLYTFDVFVVSMFAFYIGSRYIQHNIDKEEKRKRDNFPTEHSISPSDNKTIVYFVASMVYDSFTEELIVLVKIIDKELNLQRAPLLLDNCSLYKNDAMTCATIAKIMGINVCVRPAPWFAREILYNKRNKTIYIPYNIIGREKYKHDASTWLLYTIRHLDLHH